MARATLLGPLQVDPEALAEPGRRLSLRDMERLVVRAHELGGDPALAVRFGLRMRISVHGYLGFATMTAATVRDARARTSSSTARTPRRTASSSVTR